MVGIGRNHTMLEANPSVFQPCLSPTPAAHLGARQDLDAERINAESGSARQPTIARGSVPFHFRAVIGPRMHTRNLGSRPSRSHPGAPFAHRARARRVAAVAGRAAPW